MNSDLGDLDWTRYRPGSPMRRRLWAEWTYRDLVENGASSELCEVFAFAHGVGPYAETPIPELCPAPAGAPASATVAEARLAAEREKREEKDRENLDKIMARAQELATKGRAA